MPRASSTPDAAAWLAAIAFVSGLGAPAHAQTGAHVPRQAVVETDAGTFVIDLDRSAAPLQVSHFEKIAAAGEYDGTIFHRVVRHGIVMGGDPVSKDPAKRGLYGTGGLNAVKAEARASAMPRGAVAAVLAPGRPDSAGSQFFVLVVEQPALVGQYTVFGMVSDGMEVIEEISETPIDETGLTVERVAIRRVTIRDTPPPEPEAFSTESAGELASYRVVLTTSRGPITIEFLPDRAPGHVRQFLRLAQAGVYDGLAFHRVVPGFVIQTGSLTTREQPLTDRQKKLIVNLPPEFNDTRHERGVVSMARGDDPGSATTSFFICTAASTALDGQYTAFGRVVEGMDVVAAIEKAPRTGETPDERITLERVSVVGSPG
jgi:peptidyl-prolyl cis-trans isomerase B (cyclophilin B)